MRKKALQKEDFPSQAMIDEFLHRQPLPEVVFTWKKPEIVSFIVSVNSLTYCKLAMKLPISPFAARNLQDMVV